VELIPPESPLTDGEIVLRMRREDDVPALAEASRDPETQRRLEDGPLSQEAQRESVSRAEEQWATGKGAPFVIADARDDRPLGLLNLQLREDQEIANLAVSVFPEARGRGIASRALRLGALWGLRELGLARVAAEAAVDNLASIRAIEKAGFQREGTLRAHCKTHGERHDCVMFSLVAADLQAG
jgi:RimJ/RimL family protein N-acetyltransferase